MKALDSGETESTMRSPGEFPPTRQQRRARLTILAIFVVCAAPIVAAFVAYFVVKPHGGQTNYGELHRFVLQFSAVLIADCNFASPLLRSPLR